MGKNKQDISDKRLALIRRLIDLAYTYSDKELFHRKFMEAVSIASLKESEIMEIGNNALKGSSDERLSEDETEMYSLMEQGFTSQEIAVICKAKSVNTVYIKRHRIKKKFKGAIEPEIALVAMGLLILDYLIVYL